MAYASTGLAGGDVSATPASSFPSVASVRGVVSNYLNQRRVYHRTLAELRSYSRRDLLDLGIDPDGLQALARRAAGLAVAER